MTYHEPTQELPVQKAESIRGIPCGRDLFAKRTATLIVFCICALISTASSKAKTIAFSGAEGAGKFTKGGRGGDVYHVTNLKDSGSGSLREGIESIKGPRTIVFDIGGMIRLKDELVIKDKSYLTIAGQTAPGKGITLADQCLQIKESKHIIVRYLRVRLGDENKPAGSGPDCITVDYCDHIILDQLSLSWGIDGNGDFRGLKYATLQWLIFSEALHDSLHGKGPHGMCSSFRDTQGPATMHHNIYASSRQRHPTINGGSDVVEFCNNLDYNWENGHNLSGDKFNLIGNYYKAGPSMRAGFRPIQLKTGKIPPTSKGYFSGNHFEGLPEEYNKDNYSAMDFKASGLGFTHAHSYQYTTHEKFEVSERFDAGKYKLTEIESAKDAYESCLKYSGCSLVRDTVDERFIKTITDNSGKIIDSQNDVGGWDPYPPIHRPENWDTDGDGMPDAWERMVGFDPDDASDGNEDRNSDGYTNVEEYLNSLTLTRFDTEPIARIVNPRNSTVYLVSDVIPVKVLGFDYGAGDIEGINLFVTTRTDGIQESSTGNQSEKSVFRDALNPGDSYYEMYVIRMIFENYTKYGRPFIS